MAFTFLRALGHEVGRSLVEADRIETARRDARGGAPRGVAARAAGRRGRRRRASTSPPGRAVGIREIPAEQMGLDIGPRRSSGSPRP